MEIKDLTEILSYCNPKDKIKIRIQGYGETEQDFAMYCMDDYFVISIAQPTNEDFEEKRWVV